MVSNLKSYTRKSEVKKKRLKSLITVSKKVHSLTLELINYMYSYILDMQDADRSEIIPYEKYLEGAKEESIGIKV